MTAVLTEPATALGTAPLTVRGLRVRIAGRDIVDRVDLEVRSGEVVGLIGRNGAGKTTTLRATLGLIRPTAGQVRLGVPRSRCGTAFDTVSALRERSAVDNLRLLADYLGVPAQPAALLDEVGLPAEAWTRAVRTYSHGMKQKVSLAGALLGDPALIVLDEPHNGLDPIAVEEVGTALRRRAAQGAAVLVSSHLVDELDRLCDRVVVIDGGRVVLTGPVDELTRARFVDVATPQPQAAIRALAEAGLPAGEQPDGIRVPGGPDRAGEIARTLVRAGVEIRALLPHTRTLTDVVRATITGGGHD